MTEGIEIKTTIVDYPKKFEQLVWILNNREKGRAVVITDETQGVVNRGETVATRLIDRLFEVYELFEGMSTADRNTVYRDFYASGTGVLVVTDRATVGIDLRFVPCVVHYHAPRTVEEFKQREGRYNRADNRPVSVFILLSAAEDAQWPDMRDMLIAQGAVVDPELKRSAGGAWTDEAGAVLTSAEAIDVDEDRFNRFMARWNQLAQFDHDDHDPDVLREQIEMISVVIANEFVTAEELTEVGLVLDVLDCCHDLAGAGIDCSAVLASIGRLVLRPKAPSVEGSQP